MKKLLTVVAYLFLLTACGSRTESVTPQSSAEKGAGTVENIETSPQNDAEKQVLSDAGTSKMAQASETTDMDAGNAKPARLLYMGQASIRIVTGEGKVIYIDPYVGDGYDPAADLILVTHGHYDHNGVEKVVNRNDDCQVITWREALKDGVHQTFDLGYVTVEAVEAGYNSYHDVRECVGYVLTLSDGISVYVSGDTSTTQQMPLLAEKQIDYAFYCCDGIYNMDLEEAAACAEMVGARHNIPYHMLAQNGVYFDRERTEQFHADNLLIIDEGEEIELRKEENGDGGEIMTSGYNFTAFTNVEITGADIASLGNEEQSVLYAQARYCQAMTDADTDTLREMVPEDAIFTHMSGRQQTREEYFADIEDGSLDYYTIGIESPVIEVNGDSATITYTSVLNANAYGARGTYRMPGTHHFEKRDGNWLSANR